MAVERYKNSVSMKVPRFVPQARGSRAAGSTEAGQAELLDTIGRTAARGISLYEQEQIKEDAKRAEDAFNMYTSELAEPRAKYINTELKGASDQYGEYAEKIASLQKTFEGSLNPRQVEMFREKLNPYKSRLESEAQMHMAKESVAMGNVNRANAEFAAVRDANVNIWDPQWHDNAANTFSNTAAQEAVQLGLKPGSKEFQAVTDLKVATKFAPFVKNMLARMGEEDPVRALPFLEKYKDYMLPQDRAVMEPRLRDAVKTAMIEQTGYDIYSRHKGTAGLGAALQEINETIPVESRSDVYKVVNELYTIDKQRTNLMREGIQGSFYNQMQKLNPVDSGSIQSMMEWIEKSVPSSIDMKNGKSLKNEMRKYLQDTLAGKFRVSDPNYVLELQRRMSEDPTGFINQEIDTSMLSLQDAKKWSQLRSGFMSPNSSELTKILSANKSYTDIADKVLRENGIIVDMMGVRDRKGNIDDSLLNKRIKGYKSIRDNLLKSFVPEYMEAVASGSGELFLDPTNPANYERNRKLLEDKFDNYVKQFKEVNGFDWTPTGTDEQSINEAIDRQRQDYGEIINRFRGQDFIRPRDGQMYRDTYRNFLENIGSQPDNYIEVE